MNGIIIYDKKDAEYNTWFIEHITEVGRENGLEIALKLSDELIIPSKELCDFAIVRNRNYRLTETLEKNGIKCFNSSYVCKLGNDKWEMYRDFSQAGIPVMYTQRSKLPYPFVLKPKDGHGGENVYLINNKDDLASAISTISQSACIKQSDLIDASNAESVQKHIDNTYIYQMPASEKGRDIRVYVVGDTILTAMERVSKGDEFRANFSLGGEANEYALTDDELKLAAKVAKHINADFVGIDIIYNNGKPVVNEIEDAVGTRMLYAKTDIDPVREFILWIKQNIQ